MSCTLSLIETLKVTNLQANSFCILIGIKLVLFKPEKQIHFYDMILGQEEAW